MDRDRSLKENRQCAVLQSYTYRPEQVVAGIFMMARTSPRTHELISKDASCKIYLSQDSSSFENWDKVFLQTDA